MILFILGLIICAMIPFVILLIYYKIIGLLKKHCHKSISYSIAAVLFLAVAASLLIFSLSPVWLADYTNVFQEERDIPFMIGLLITLIVTLFTTQKYGVKF